MIIHSFKGEKNMSKTLEFTLVNFHYFKQNIIQIKLLIETKFEYHMLVYGEVCSLVVNIMTDSVITAPPGKSGIRLKREI